MKSAYKIAAVLGAILGFAALLISVAAFAGRGGGGEGAGAANAQTIDVELGDLFIKPGAISASPNADVTLKIHNGGGSEHDLSLPNGTKTPRIQAGQTVLLHVGKVAESMTVFCTVPGHREAGMQAVLAVGGGDAMAGMNHAPGAMTSAQMDASYLAGVKAFPAATKGEGGLPLAPKIDNGVKVFDLTAAEIDWEVAPGEIKHGMAYNGMIPGPTIRVALGDKVRIVLHNNLKESTAMHFHGLTVPNSMDGVPGITQPLVLPGQTFSYDFTVRNSGTHMYHSHMNAASQVPAGLLGAFLVDGANEPTVAQDQLMVLNDGPLGYSINGKGFPATKPIVAKPGERIRVRYMNEGMQIHPMHLHGLTQTVIALDGNAVPAPYVEDTVMVAPGQRVDVLITASEPGIWAYHCHILTHAETEAGMYGMVTAFIVKA